MSYWVRAYFVFSHHALPKLINPWSKNNTDGRHLRGLFLVEDGLVLAELCRSLTYSVWNHLVVLIRHPIPHIFQTFHYLGYSMLRLKAPNLAKQWMHRKTFEDSLPHLLIWYYNFTLLSQHMQGSMPSITKCWSKTFCL